MTAAELIQRQHIAAERARLKPSEVRLHHVPNWFRLATLQAFGTPWRYYTAGWSMIQRLQQVDERVTRWLDHWGSTRLDGRIVFVSEPYGLTDGSLASIEFVCNAIGCNWYTSTNSWWYPGHTVRVVIYPKESSQ